MLLEAAPAGEELAAEELRLPSGDAHGGEDDHDLGVVAGRSRLGSDPGGESVGGQPGAGEDRQLLAADERDEAVDGRDTGLDELVGVGASDRVERQAVDVAVGVRDGFGTAVAWPARPSSTRPK